LAGPSYWCIIHHRLVHGTWAKSAIGPDTNGENDVNDAKDEVVDGPTVLAHVDLARTICEFTVHLIFFITSFSIFTTE
jgi:hypothetical protein